MAIYETTKRINNVKDLREFLEGLPDNTKILSDMGDPMTVSKMTKHPDERGPNIWLLFEEATS